MRKSKFMGLVSGNWICTHVGVAKVQPKFLTGTRIPRKSPGHQEYYYIFERMTSDKKAEKLLRLSANEATKVWKNEITVDEIEAKREATKAVEFTKKISYHFVDRT